MKTKNKKKKKQKIQKNDNLDLLHFSQDELSVLKNQVIAEQCRRSFYFFVKTMWDSFIAENFVPNWHIKYICKELQKAAERVFRREPKKYDIIINVPPGTTKSTLCSVMFPVWVWTRDPTLKSICSSYSGELSLNLSVKSRDLVRTDLFNTLFPEIKVRSDLDAKGYFGLETGGERFSTSTSGTATGMHGHFLIIDDPLNPRESISEVSIKGCTDWYDRTFSTRKVDKRVSLTLLIMQRLSEDDLTQHILDINEGQENRIKHICLPAEDNYEIKPERLKKYYKNGLLDTVRLDKQTLEENEKTLGPLDYAGQFGQSPKRSGGNLFLEDKVSVVKHYDSEIIQKVRYWDKAGTAGGTGAQTAGSLIGLMKSGRVVVLDCITGRWSSEVREKIIRDTANIDEIDGIPYTVVVEQEPGSGGKESAEYSIKNLLGFAVYADRVTGDKVVRATPWSIAWNRGDVLIMNRPWTKDFIKEHLFFPRGRTKDMVDASAGAYAWLIKKQKRGGLW
jgi:predicted phage terminase large subunit-like protein